MKATSLIFVAAAMVVSLVLAPSTGAGTIGRAALDGTGANSAFLTIGGLPEGIAVDGDHIYWTDRRANTIGRARLDGTDIDPNLIRIGASPISVSVGGSRIYWTTAGSPPAIGRARLDGTAVEPVFISDTSNPSAVSVNESQIFWTGGVAFEAGDLVGRIGRASLDGADVDRSFLRFAGYPFRLAVSESHVYWSGVNLRSRRRSGPTPLHWDPAQAFEGSIGYARLDGGDIDERLIGDLNGARDVAVDGAHVYWSSSLWPAIGRASLDGVGANPAFIDLPAAGVAVDGTHVYWTSDAPRAPSSRGLDLGRLKLHRKRGTATLPVNVSGPGMLMLTRTKRVKPVARLVDQGWTKLRIAPRGKAKNALERNGRARVRANVAYRPDAGDPLTRTRSLALIKRR